MSTTTATTTTTPNPTPCRPSFPTFTRRYHYTCCHCHARALLYTLHLSPRNDIFSIRCWNCFHCPIDKVEQRVTDPKLIEHRKWVCWACDRVQKFEYFPDGKGGSLLDASEECSGCGRERDGACTVVWAEEWVSSSR